MAELGMTRIMIETDAEILGRALTSEEYDGSSDGGLFRQIREFMSLQFVFCSVSVCPRMCNRVADRLAAYGASVVNASSCVFMSQTLDFVYDLVSGYTSRASE